MDDTVRENFRARIKADELEAERLLMQALFALTQGISATGEVDDHTVAKQAITTTEALAEAWNGAVARSQLNSLIEALTKGDFLRYNP
jgi:hypothetical protein